MRTLRRPDLLTRTAPIAVAAAMLAACSVPHITADPVPAPRGPYVALGDSYTSAPKVPDQVGTPTGCDRSDHDYPSLVAQHLALTSGEVHDISCSGAKITDLTTPQNTGSGTNPAQFSALTADTRLVTIGIGGNDIDFAGILTRCVELDAPGTLIDLIRGTTADRTPCRADYTSGGTDKIQQEIRTAATQLAAALTRIRRIAPHAHVYVVGYPDLLPSTDGAACAKSLGITPGDVTYLNAKEAELNSMLKQQATGAGDDYVDTYTPSVGHDACSDAATRWIEPLLPDAPAAVMHPNTTGEQGMANAVEQAIAAGG